MLPRSNPRQLAVVFAVLVAAMLAGLAALRTPIDQVIADEGTYLAMIESLRQDGDLLFGEPDRQRIEAQSERGRQEVILQRGAGGQIAYSKPILFPLFSLPFAPLFGERGPMVMNALALLAAVWLALRYLAALGRQGGQDPRLGELLMVTFLGAAVVIPYVFWRMGDALQLALGLAGLTLALERQRLDPARCDRVGPREWIGMLLLAALMTLRISNGIVGVVPILAALLGRRFRRAAWLAAALVAAVGLWAVASYLMTGATNPYRAVRTAFLPETGYPPALPAAELDNRFDEFRRSHHTAVNTPASLRQATFAGIYFLVGRHTGLLFYFPAAVLLLLLALRRSDAVGLAALFAFFATTAFFVGWKPDNYFGGETFLGNRYLISYYPVLLFAVPRLPSLRQLLLPWLVALVAYGSAFWSENTKGELPGSQSHTARGVFALLPVETVAQFLEGTIDRYWAGQLVRFISPPGRINSVNFELSSEDRATEVVLAQWEIPSTLRFAVQTDAPEATFEVADFNRVQSFDIGPDATPRTLIGVQVNVRPSRPWRRHYFWFAADRPYYVRVLELRLRSPRPAKALVTFFGDPLLLEQLANYQLHGLTWPAEPPRAGERAELRFLIENRGSRSWQPGDSIGTSARWRFFQPKEGGGFDLAKDSGPLALPAIQVAETVEVALPLTWPERPGTYELELDLVIDHMFFFQERRGHPVARQRFEVLPAPPPPAPP